MVDSPKDRAGTEVNFIKTDPENRNTEYKNLMQGDEKDKEIEYLDMEDNNELLYDEDQGILIKK